VYKTECAGKTRPLLALRRSLRHWSNVIICEACYF